MSDFGALNTALSALYAHRRALEVTGQNISNANTDGYSRQRVDLVADAGPTLPAIHSPWTGGGQGVDVTSVSRTRDGFLESRALAEHASLAALDVEKATLARVEEALGEPGDSGLQRIMDEYWMMWEQVSTNPDLIDMRGSLIEKGREITDTLNRAVQNFSSIWDSNRELLKATIDDVNVTAGGIAQLNATIQTAVQGGLSPNDLMDQRDQLVMSIAESVGVRVVPGEDGVVNLFVGGSPLVKGKYTEKLQVVGPDAFGAIPNPSVGASPHVAVVWAQSGRTAGVTGGSAAGNLSALNSTLPTYRERLDQVANKLGTSVNTLHESGYDLDGAPGEGFFGDAVVGPPFFAASIRVALTDPRKIAASDVAPAIDPRTGLPVRNLGEGNARAMALLGNQTGGVNHVYRSVVADLGQHAGAVNSRSGFQASVVQTLDAQREGFSGVNLDEEMANMVAFQHAYNGAARYMSAIDEMLDTLINRTGTVGR